jgi:hypothetical protein
VFLQALIVWLYPLIAPMHDVDAYSQEASADGTTERAAQWEALGSLARVAG